MGPSCFVQQKGCFGSAGPGFVLRGGHFPLRGLARRAAQREMPRGLAPYIPWVLRQQRGFGGGGA